MAVQVNNWDQRRHNKVSEIEMLKAINAEMEFNLKALTQIEIIENQINSSEIIIEQLENHVPYHDSLAHHFLETCNFPVSAFNKGAYETLKSVGVSMISNPELRSDIITLYDLNYVFIDEFAKGLQNNFLYAEKHLFNKRFVEANNYWWDLGEDLEILDTGGGMVPLDFDRLKNDSEYIYYLKSTKNKNKLFQTSLENAIEEISLVMESIEEELKELKS